MEDHSLKGYLERQPTDFLKVILYNYLQYDEKEKNSGLGQLILEILKKREDME